VVSHISRKTSEIWGTPRFAEGRKQNGQPGQDYVQTRLVRSVVKVLAPFVVGVADHAHDVTAGVQGEGARFAQ
jgi:hypothetical protein